MTFTLVSHLREQLSSLVEKRVQARVAEEREKERLVIEVGVCIKYSWILSLNGNHSRPKKPGRVELLLQ